MRRQIGRIIILILLSGGLLIVAHVSRAATGPSPGALTGKLLWSYDTGG